MLTQCDKKRLLFFMCSIADSNYYTVFNKNMSWGTLTYETWGSCHGVAEVSSLLGCDAVSMGW